MDVKRQVVGSSREENKAEKGREVSGAAWGPHGGRVGDLWAKCVQRSGEDALGAGAAAAQVCEAECSQRAGRTGSHCGQERASRPFGAFLLWARRRKPQEGVSRRVMS